MAGSFFNLPLQKKIRNLDCHRIPHQIIKHYDAQTPKSDNENQKVVFVTPCRNEVTSGQLWAVCQERSARTPNHMGFTLGTVILLEDLAENR
jgi:hypothetical protein